MKGWEVRKLGDLLEIQNGFAFDSKAFSPNGEQPLIRIRDLKGGVTTETRYDGDFDRRYVVRKGDYLIGMDGEFGCYEWKGSDALLNQRVCKLHSFDHKLNSRFLFYGINKFLKDIEEVTGFTTVKHLSSKQIACIEFPIAPLDEQRRIVAILDEAFAGLAVMRQHAEANLKNARALFDSHLNAIFSQRGEGWVVRPLGEVADCCLGKMLDKAKNRGTPMPYLRNINVRWFEFDLSDVLEMPFEDHEFDRYSAVSGDVLICEGGYPGRAAIWQSDEPMFFQKAIHRVRFADRDRAQWLVYYLWFLDRSGQLKSHFTGAGIQHFTGQALKRLEIPLPPLDAQSRIVARIVELQAETTRLESLYRQKLAAIDELRQSILHRAFSGALSAKDALAA